MKSFLVLCLVASLVVIGKSEPAEDVGSSGSGSCYLSCIFGDCKKSAFQCALCLGRCVISLSESNGLQAKHMTNRDFCNIGCSTSLCTKFAVSNDQYRDYADEREVKGCLNSCSQRCAGPMY